jgi:hypothetical protein
MKWKSFLLLGESDSGKQYFIVNYLENVNHATQHKQNIVYFYNKFKKYSYNNKLFTIVTKWHEKLPTIEDINNLEEGSILIVDGFGEEIIKDYDLLSLLFHQKKIMVFLLVENIVFNNGNKKWLKEVDKQANVVFFNPDKNKEIFMWSMWKVKEAQTRRLNIMKEKDLETLELMTDRYPDTEMEELENISPTENQQENTQILSGILTNEDDRRNKELVLNKFVKVYPDEDVVILENNITKLDEAEKAEHPHSLLRRILGKEEEVEDNRQLCFEMKRLEELRKRQLKLERTQQKEAEDNRRLSFIIEKQKRLEEIRKRQLENYNLEEDEDLRILEFELYYSPPCFPELAKFYLDRRARAIKRARARLVTLKKRYCKV